MTQFTIWHDNDLNLAHWIKRKSLLGEYRDVLFQILYPPTNRRSFPKIPREIQQLLYLDKHDIIITFAESGAQIPIIALEFMTHTPQSQHTKQRFCRIVSSAEHAVPCAFIFPEKKASGGQMYKCTTDIFYAFQKLMDIHRVPIFGYYWPDDNGILKHSRRYPSAPLEKGQIKDLFQYINLCLNYAIQGKPATLLLREPILFSHLDFNRSKAYEHPVEISRYKGLSLKTTDELVRELERDYSLQPANLPDYFIGREMSLVQTPEFRTAKSKFRTDPYAGMQAFFDYCFCRVGETTIQRRYNLVFHAVGIQFKVYSKMYHSYWKTSCPFNDNQAPDNIPLLNLHIKAGCTYTKNKQLRTYGYLSDMIIFDDFVVFG
jgi:hypothetical protein